MGHVATPLLCGTLIWQGICSHVTPVSGLEIPIQIPIQQGLCSHITAAPSGDPGTARFMPLFASLLKGPKGLKGCATICKSGIGKIGKFCSINHPFPAFSLPLR